MEGGGRQLINLSLSLSLNLTYRRSTGLENAAAYPVDSEIDRCETLTWGPRKSAPWMMKAALLKFVKTNLKDDDKASDCLLRRRTTQSCQGQEQGLMLTLATGVDSREVIVTLCEQHYRWTLGRTKKRERRWYQMVSAAQAVAQARIDIRGTCRKILTKAGYTPYGMDACMGE
jgi:hypothetical protein